LELASRSEETNHKGRYLILDIELVEPALDRLPKGLWLPRRVMGHRDIVSEYLYIFILAFLCYFENSPIFLDLCYPEPPALNLLQSAYS